MGELTKTQGDFLLRVARSAILKKLTGKGEIPTSSDDVFRQISGTFVTLKIEGQLRGCIGNLDPVGSILESIERNALNAAFSDYRFRPLTLEELGRTHIDISILTPANTLSYIDAEDLVRKLRPGVDGIILRQETAGATFLPQVWEQLPDAKDFLGHLCRKAGLSETAWRTSHPEILVYQVQCFEEEA